MKSSQVLGEILIHHQSSRSGQRSYWQAWYMVLPMLLLTTVSRQSSAQPGRNDSALDESTATLVRLLASDESQVHKTLDKRRVTEGRVVEILQRLVRSKPQSRRTELAAAAAARYLASSPTESSIIALCEGISLPGRKFAESQHLSSRFALGQTRLQFPCVDALISVGEPAVGALVNTALTRTSGTVLQTELAAYALLEIREHNHPDRRIEVSQEVRATLVREVNRAVENLTDAVSVDQNEASLLIEFLETVEVVYYRARPRGRSRLDMSPPPRSVLFDTTRK